MELTKISDVLSSAETYEDMLKEHIVSMSAELRTIKPSSLIVVGMSDAGNFYSMVKCDELTRLVGSLEFTKTYLVSQAIADEDDEEDL